MDRLQPPIHPPSLTSLGYEELEEAYLLTSSLQDTIPFLQMLQSVESDQPFNADPKFQNLTKPWEEVLVSQSQELVVDLLYSSPIHSETNQNQHPNSAHGGVCNQNQTNLCRTQMAERRKRKRSRPSSSKNKEDVESQRMTHIAVERNRRRQMNDHLNVIKSLIPISYTQRGDQASIIGGAIDFVKELEQLLESLEAERKLGEESLSSSSSSSPIIGKTGEGVMVCAELKSEVAEIEATLIQTHVNLKIKCPKRQGQLLKAIVALEDLSLTVLHLNITTTAATVLYSFNLKIEDECKLGTAEQIAATVHQILSFINDGRLVNEGKANFRQDNGSGSR